MFRSYSSKWPTRLCDFLQHFNIQMYHWPDYGQVFLKLVCCLLFIIICSHCDGGWTVSYQDIPELYPTFMQQILIIGKASVENKIIFCSDYYSTVSCNGVIKWRGSTMVLVARFWYIQSSISIPYAHLRPVLGMTQFVALVSHTNGQR